MPLNTNVITPKSKRKQKPSSIPLKKILIDMSKFSEEALAKIINDREVSGKFRQNALAEYNKRRTKND